MLWLKQLGADSMLGALLLLLLLHYTVLAFISNHCACIGSFRPAARHYAKGNDALNKQSFSVNTLCFIVLFFNLVTAEDKHSIHFNKHKAFYQSDSFVVSRLM